MDGGREGRWKGGRLRADERGWVGGRGRWEGVREGTWVERRERGRAGGREAELIKYVSSQ